MGGETVQNVVIEHCNCITKANVKITPHQLNIKFGTNGTGKSTIGDAILAASLKDEGKELQKLLPYGADIEKAEECPHVSNLTYSNVKVFNDKYANSFLFRGDNLFQNPFQIFLRSPECDDLSENITSLLKDLQDSFQASDDFTQIHNLLLQVQGIIKTKQGNSISKAGGLGELIKGNGFGFDKHAELVPYKDYYSNSDFSEVTSWANWRRDGIKHLNKSNSCPFCAEAMKTDTIQKQNKAIESVFKNSALNTANKLLEFFKGALSTNIISSDSVAELEGYLGDKNHGDEITADLSALIGETNYLLAKIDKILEFKPVNVTREEIGNINQTLQGMKIDINQLNKFYSSNKVKDVVSSVNNKIQDLTAKAGILIGLFNKYDQKLKSLIKSRGEDINDFLILSGFPYKFNITPTSENEAITYLVPVSNSDIKVTSPSEHLSWGERNAFSLVMFMFDATSSNADLIILDDPISAFDCNKKFAVIQRMFDNQKPSFRDKTVLMLTHDTQPLLDYVMGNFFNRYGLTTEVNATYLENKGGIISESDITPADFESAIQLSKKISEDLQMPMACRVINYRKYLEYNSSQANKSTVYHILSNLIHGRLVPTKKVEIEGKIEETELSRDEITEGYDKVKAFLRIPYPDYSAFVDVLSTPELKQEYQHISDSDGSKYDKTIIARFLFERYDDMMKKLRKEYPGLCKYLNETNHIENDYIFQLDPRKYFNLPTDYEQQLNDFVDSNFNF